MLMYFYNENLSLEFIQMIFSADILIDLLYSVLRRIGNISAIYRQTADI